MLSCGRTQKKDISGVAREEFPEEVTPGKEEVTRQVKDKDTVGRENSLASEFKVIARFLIPVYSILRVRSHALPTKRAKLGNFPFFQDAPTFLFIALSSQSLRF